MRHYLLAGLLMAAVAVSRAEEPTKQPTTTARIGAGLRTWFMNLKEGLAESSVSSQRQKTRVTSVAAVRGDDQSKGRGVAGIRGATQHDPSEADRVTWKSGQQSRKMKQLRQEKAQFSSAVDLILAGKFKEGNDALDAFEQAYPTSSLLPDVRETREKLKEAQTEAAVSEKPAAIEDADLRGDADKLE